MTANKDLGRRLSDLYEAEAAPRAPEWLLEQSLEIDRRHQTAARGHPRALEAPDRSWFHRRWQLRPLSS